MECMKKEGCYGNVVTSRNPETISGWNWKGEMVVDKKYLASLSAGDNF